MYDLQKIKKFDCVQILHGISTTTNMQTLTEN